MKAPSCPQEELNLTRLRTLSTVLWGCQLCHLGSSAMALLSAGLTLLLFRGPMLLPVHTAGTAGLPCAQPLCKAANREGSFHPLFLSP